MTLSINLESIKNQKAASNRKLVAIYAIPLIVALYIYQQEATLLASYLSVFISVCLFIGMLVIVLKKDEKASSFSVPEFSEYATIQEAAPLPAKPRRWSIRLLKEMEWKKFEELCLGFFFLKGANAQLIPKGTNGYIELRLDHSTKVNAVVKHKTSLKDIGVKEIKALLTLMAQLNVQKGFYMTAGSFSTEAKAFAKEHKVTLISGGMLLTMLKRLRVSQQKKLLAKAIEGDYKAPTCPACNIKMVSRHGPHQDKYYWGCVNKPKCRHIMPRQSQRQAPRW